MSTKVGKGKPLYTTLGVSSFRDATNINQTLEQMRKMKEENEHFQKQLTATQQDLQEKNLRVRVLEDALAFRSEEIGLAGHADLLAKVAQLKSEVRALKDELSDKTTRISSIQEDKSRLSTEQESLQQKIAAIQERLAKSEQEAYKYSNSDLGILLKNVEKERDVLLDYIQQDMEKSGTFAKQVEKLESELRQLKRRERDSQEENDLFRTENEKLKEDFANSEQEYEKLRQEKRTLSLKIEELEHREESLQIQLSQKGREEDEIMKHQLSLFAQLRAKDEELMRKTEEIISLRAKVQECDLILPSVKDDNLHMKDQLKLYENDLTALKKKLIELESENRALSSSANRLQQENKHLQTECHEQSQELQELRPYKLLVNDLDNDLSNFKDSDITTAMSSDSPSEALSPGTPFSHLNSSATSIHVHFSPPNNSSMVTPKKEQEQELLYGDGLLSQLTAQARSTSKFTKVESFSSPVQSNSAKNALTSSSTSQLSLSQHHSLWIGLPSIRKLHPRLYEKIRHLAQDLHRKETECSDIHYKYEKLWKESSVDKKDAEGRIAYLSMCHSSDQETITAMTGKLHALESEYYSLKDAKMCLNQIRTVISALSEHPLLGGPDEVQGEGDQFKRSYMLHIDNVADTAIPNVIQEILSANTQAVLTLRDTLDRCRRLDIENKDLASKLQYFTKENAELVHRVSILQDELASKTNKIQESEEDVQDQLNLAAELAEKQNALMLSLEAKIESLHREKQLKNAQISAIQQREETLRTRLISYFDKERVQIPINNPSLSDLVYHLMEDAKLGNNYIQPHLNNSDQPSRAPHNHQSGRTYNNKSAANYDHHYEQKHYPVDTRNYASYENDATKRPVSPQYGREEQIAGRNATRIPIENQSRVTIGRRPHYPSDNEIISSMAEREARSISTRMQRNEQQKNDNKLSDSHRSRSQPLSSSSYEGPSVAAQALQDRIKKAQQTFRAMRDFSTNHQ